MASWKINLTVSQCLFDIGFITKNANITISKISQKGFIRSREFQGEFTGVSSSFHKNKIIYAFIQWPDVMFFKCPSPGG